VGFRNPLSVASSVDTRTASGGAGVRAYQQTSGTLTNGVLEYLTGLPGVSSSTLQLLTTGLTGGGAGSSSFELTGSGHHSKVAPALALRVEQDLTQAGNPYVGRAFLSADQVLINGKVTGSSTVLDSRVIARSFTPAGTGVLPNIPANGAKQSGIGPDPAIADIVTTQACVALVVALFRVSPNAAGGAALPSIVVNGAGIGSAVIRSPLDETRVVIGVANLIAGANSLGLRVDASLVAVNWLGASIGAILGNAE
jgi:hypothetical protein